MKLNDILEKKMITKCELYNDHFENAKKYNIPRAQLIVADIPYQLGNNAYASNPQWYKDGDNKNGEFVQDIPYEPKMLEYSYCRNCGRKIKKGE